MPRTGHSPQTGEHGSIAGEHRERLSKPMAAVAVVELGDLADIDDDLAGVVEGAV